MQVLKSGDGRKGWSKECVCTGNGNQVDGCGAVLLVEQAGLFVTTSQARGRQHTAGDSQRTTTRGATMDNAERDQLLDHIAQFLGRTYRRVERDEQGRETVSYRQGLDHVRDVQVVLTRDGAEMSRPLGDHTLRLTIEVS